MRQTIRFVLQLIKGVFVKDLTWVNMNSSDKARDYAINLIREGEGVRYTVYWDGTGEPIGETDKGIPTIGVGTNLNIPITDKTVDYLLGARLYKYIDNLRYSIDFWDRIDYLRQAVLIDMAYNIGVFGLMQFNHLLDAVKNNNPEEMADGIFYSNYFKQVGGRAKRNLMIMLRGKKYTKAEAIDEFGELSEYN